MASKAAFLTVSFSGAGHLLPYHLGVASVLLSSSFLPPIRAVSGSSSGSIAAVLVARLPHRIDDFSNTFIDKRGEAVKTLQEMIHEEEQHRPGKVRVEDDKRILPSLHIATTRCFDGSLKMFDFEPHKRIYRSLSLPEQHDQLIRCLNASCRIPSSFHLMDVMSSSGLSYPNDEGIEINGDFFVDGAIAGPAPPTPHDDKDNGARIVVSPISGSATERIQHRISPSDISFALGRGWVCNGDFSVRPSLQNLRSIIASIGVADSDLLRKWFQQGIADAENFVDSWR